MKTDLKMIREQSKLLFDIVEPSIANEELGELFLIHPYTQSAFVGIQNNGNLQMINILESEKNYQLWREHVFKQIDSLSLHQIWVMLISNPWYLTWLKIIKCYLSKEDFAQLLGELWVSQENPNSDVNVSIEEAISWFKEADKKNLMSEEDYLIFQSLPKEIEVYRGVSLGRNKMGLSYTKNKTKAEWFKKRFETENEKGILLHSIIKKENVLAYFNTRDEDELVVDSLSINFNEL